MTDKATEKSNVDPQEFEAEYPLCPADKEMEYLVRAKYTLVYVVTWEERRVIKSLERICELPDINMAGVQVWDVAQGLRTSKEFAVAGGENLTTPEAILDYIAKKAEENNGKAIRAKAARGPIFVLCDMFRFMSPEGMTPEIERRMRNLSSALKLSSVSVYITSPELQIPTALDKCVTVVDYALPAKEQLNAAVVAAKKVLHKLKKYMSAKDYEAPHEDVVRALMGLTIHEADDALAKSWVMTGKFDVKTILDLKRQIIRKGQLLDYIHSNESLDTVGGFAGVKQFVSLRKKAFGGEAEKYGLPTPKGIFLFGVQGSGKSLCAKAVANEFQFPLLKLSMGRMFGSLVGESLAPEEEIIVYEDDTCRRMQIQDLCEERPHAKVESYTRDMRVKISDVTGYIKHERTSDLVEVATRSGRRIRVTTDHSLFTLSDDGLLEEVSPSDLRPGSPIAIPLGRVDLNRVTSIDVIKLILASGTECEWFVSDAVQVLGMNVVRPIAGKSVGAYASSRSAMSLSKLMRAGVSLPDVVRLQRRSGDTTIPSKMPLNEEIMELLGWFAAEGSDGKDERLSVHADEVAEVESLCYRNGLKATSYVDGNAASIFVHGKAFGSLLGLLGMKSKRIPPWVFGTSAAYKCAFLRGYFSGDGGISGKNIEASSSIELFAGDVLSLLASVGIFASKYPRKDSGWRICISTGVMKARFAGSIGFSLSRKNALLGTMPMSDVDVRMPMVGFIKDAIKNARRGDYAMGKCKSYGGHHSWTRKNSIRSILQEVDDHDVAWDKVKSITRLDEQPRYVYDISVQDTENFVAGIGGILCHNSESNMRRALQLAESIAPCVLFVDEIDKALSGATGVQSDSGTTRRVIGHLIDWMQEKTSPVFIVACANSIQGLPPELTRKGRFDEMFFVDLPTTGERGDIFEIHLRKIGRDPAKFDLNKLASSTEGFSGAEIEGVITDAMFNAFDDDGRELTTDDVMNSVKVCVPLSTVRKEEIDELRESARNRMRNASNPIARAAANGAASTEAASRFDL